MKHEALIEGREWQPRDLRVDCNSDVVVNCSIGDLSARIVNLSSDGFRLHSDAALEVGSEVTLSAKGCNPVKALICWASGHEAGGIFAESVSL